MNPAEWQYLGKASGWKKKVCERCGFLVNEKAVIIQVFDVVAALTKLLVAMRLTGLTMLSAITNQSLPELTKLLVGRNSSPHNNLKTNLASYPASV